MIRRADNLLAGPLGAVLCATVGLTAAPAAAGTALVEAAPSPHRDDMTLWYDKPATNWESEPLPIGNGALGAMVFGGVATEQLQFNEKTLWTGAPGARGYNFGNWTKPRPGALAEVQQRIAADKRVNPSWVAGKLGQPKSGFGAYQTTSGGYRRLFDFQPSGNAGTDGVLIDLTPSNQVRFIGSGQNATTSAVVPTGRYVDLVVVMPDGGTITVYIDGAVTGSAQVPPDGINDCATRQLRLAADQGGGQRLTGADDRVAIIADDLTADEVRGWRQRAFG